MIIMTSQPENKDVDFRLEIQQAVYVPSTNKSQQFIGTAAFTARIKETERFLTKTFGGFTRLRGVGGFTGEGGVIREAVAKVESFSSKKGYKAKQNKLIAWLKRKKKEWGQQNIGIIIEGDLSYI